MLTTLIDLRSNESASFPQDGSSANRAIRLFHVLLLASQGTS
jgi:hypothetical protein